MIAIDTNLLVYAHRSRTTLHAQARKAIDRAAAGAEGWGIAAVSLPEFWAIATHPAAEGQPSTPSQAGAFVKELVQAGAQIWLPGPGFGDRLLQLAIDLDVAGSRVFDLQIALVAFEGGATDLWTDDAHFVKIPGLRLHDPL
jgi:hypothetical protein